MTKARKAFSAIVPKKNKPTPLEPIPEKIPSNKKIKKHQAKTRNVIKQGNSTIG